MRAPIPVPQRYKDTVQAQIPEVTAAVAAAEAAASRIRGKKHIYEKGGREKETSVWHTANCQEDPSGNLVPPFIPFLYIKWMTIYI